jgi:hypothetical protein
MRKWYLLPILLGCAAIVIATATLARKEQPIEPTYNGQPLSYWVTHSMNTAERDGATDALRHIGTNALPLLLKWIRYKPEPPAWRTNLSALPWLPQRVQRFIRGRTDFRSEMLCYEAVDAFGALGTNAAAAIPELTVLMVNSYAPERGCRVARALAYIGTTNALPALVSVANVQRFRYLQFDAVLAISRLTPRDGSLNDIIGPVMVRALTNNVDKQAPVGRFAAEEAAKWLIEAHYPPGSSVPALAACLGRADADYNLRWLALLALEQYGPDAAAALPAITNVLFLSSPGSALRNDAESAIRKITGEVLAEPAPQ